MAGAITGALGGAGAVPQDWLDEVAASEQESTSSLRRRRLVEVSRRASGARDDARTSAATPRDAARLRLDDDPARRGRSPRTSSPTPSSPGDSTGATSTTSPNGGSPPAADLDAPHSGATAEPATPEPSGPSPACSSPSSTPCHPRQRCSPTNPTTSRPSKPDARRRQRDRGRRLEDGCTAAGSGGRRVPARQAGREDPPGRHPGDRRVDRQLAAARLLHRRRTRPRRRRRAIPWNRASRTTSLAENIAGMPEDDDLNFALLALLLVERHGDG